MIQWIKKNAWFVAVVISLFGSIALGNTMAFENEKTAYTNSTVTVILFLLSTVLLQQAYNRINFSDKRGVSLSLLFSAFISIAISVGKQLHTVENCNFLSIALWINIAILTLYFAGYVLFFLQWLDAREGAVECEAAQAKDPSLKQLLLCWLVILLCWIPVFLAFYPGAFVYDAQDEYVQVATREFTTHHPLLHVLLLGGAVCFGNKFMGSYNAGIALYTIFQMVVFSGVLAYSVCYVMERLQSRDTGVRKWTKRVMLAFYGLFPIFPMYAVCSSKDTFFHAALLICVIQLIKLCGSTADMKKEGGIFVVSSVLMMLLRNNAVYAYAVLLVALVLIQLVKKSKGYRTILICMALSLVLYKVGDVSFAKVLHASDIESQEVLTVPIQQLARTHQYSPEIFSDEDKEILYSYIPADVLAVYDADLSDLVKANFDNHRYAQDSASFLKLWAKMGLKKPFTYLNAWLMTSYGYWYPDTVINVYGGQDRFTFQYGESSYFGFETEQPGVRESKLPWLEEQYRKLSLEIYQQNVPVVSMLFSPGFLFFVFAACYTVLLYQKKTQLYLPMALVLLVWATFLLGPTFLVRYILILWLGLPVILTESLRKQ